MNFEISDLSWDQQGLLPAIIQDTDSLQVLMMGYMNQQALQLTIDKKLVHFYSRSRQKLWLKGETSGNYLQLQNSSAISADCDKDCLLILAKPQGPTCHRQCTSCFDGSKTDSLLWLNTMQQIIAKRCNINPEESYIAKLFHLGTNRIAQKVIEEAGEMAIAASTKADNTAEEAADLTFHFMMLLKAANLNLQQIIKVLQERQSIHK